MVKARAKIRIGEPIGKVHRRLFGSFVEHLGPLRLHRHLRARPPDRRRATGSARTCSTSSASSASRPSATPAATSSRATAGRTASARARTRPRRLDLAWHSTETNEVGLDEFVALGRRGPAVEPMLAVNLGTRGVQEALDAPRVRQRRPAAPTCPTSASRNGRAEPYDIRMWCLGNEMDGPWQLGHSTADDYGTLAAETAAAMRRSTRRSSSSSAAPRAR